MAEFAQLCLQIPLTAIFIAVEKDMSDIYWPLSQNMAIYIYRACMQSRFRRACASAQSRRRLGCEYTQRIEICEESGKNIISQPQLESCACFLKNELSYECEKSQYRMGLLCLFYVFIYGQDAYCLNIAPTKEML